MSAAQYQVRLGRSTRRHTSYEIPMRFPDMRINQAVYEVRAEKVSGLYLRSDGRLWQWLVVEQKWEVVSKWGAEVCGM